MKKFILQHTLVLCVAWALVILALCSMPGQYIPSISFLELLSFDKWVHAGMFFVLCALLFIYLFQKKKTAGLVWPFFFLAVGYGCALEIMQGLLFSNRSADINDMIANTVGCIFSLIFYRKIYEYLMRT